MVSGGTYGTEQIISGAGYGHGILILLFLPVLWCLPTAYMIGELSSSLPCEGGYYAWVRRGLGNFWGFQEAWLSLAASIFDMAIYPTLFVFYLKQFSPWFGTPSHGILAGLFVVVKAARCSIWRVFAFVGITSLWLFFCLSAPFAVIVALAPFKAGTLTEAHAAPAAAGLGLVGGVLVAMWNYMGWDNASTIAQEVEAPAENLSEGDDRSGGIGLTDLCAAVPGGLFHRDTSVDIRGRRLVGDGRGPRRRENCWI